MTDTRDDLVSRIKAFTEDYAFDIGIVRGTMREAVAEIERLQALLAPAPTLEAATPRCPDCGQRHTLPHCRERVAPAPIEEREVLAQIYEAAGDKAAAFTLRRVGAVGTIFEAQVAVLTRALQGSAEVGEDWFKGEVDCGGNKLVTVQLDHLTDVVALIEGFPGYGTCTNALEGMRLKDQPAWVRFYNVVATLPPTQADRLGQGEEG